MDRITKNNGGRRKEYHPAKHTDPRSHTYGQLVCRDVGYHLGSVSSHHSFSTAEGGRNLFLSFRILRVYHITGQGMCAYDFYHAGTDGSRAAQFVHPYFNIIVRLTQHRSPFFLGIDFPVRQGLYLGGHHLGIPIIIYLHTLLH